MTCEGIIGYELKEEEFEIAKIQKLGKKDQNKIRYILIQLRDDKDKFGILEKAKILKDSEK